MTFMRELPVYAEVDVLVVGAGPAGACAAVAAARGGARVLLIDENGCVGGSATVGLVGPFMTSFDAKDEHMVIKGMFKEVLDRMIALGGAIDPADIPGGVPQSGFYQIGHAHVGPFDHECLKRVLTKMIADSGAKLLLHTRFLDVEKRGDAIEYVIIANKSGMSAVRAKVVIDCSGDADVCARAGAQYEVGSAVDGNIQPATLFFRVYNVDTEAMKAHIKAHENEIRPFYGPYSWLIRDRQAEWGDVPRAEICLFEGVEPGEFRLNVTRILDIDGTDAEELSRAEIEGLKQAHQVFDFLRKYAVGFENARFMGTAGMVGIRESRHIHGLHYLTGDEVRACEVPQDAIAVMATNMDTHNRSDPGGTFHTLTNGPYFGVPYGCLVVKGIDNLLVAGRSISADSMAASAIRMIPCCMVFGQAAGAAAALAVKADIGVRAVNVPELRALLKKDGAFLPEPGNRR